MPALDLSAAEKVVISRERYVCHPLLDAMHNSLARFRIICCGRRFGKSSFAIAESLKMSSEVSQEGYQSPSLRHRPRGLFMAPTYEMVFEDWQLAKAMLQSIIREEHTARMSFDLGPFGDVDFKSAESKGGTGRGAGYDWAVLDEAARIPEEAWEADLRPALSDRRGRAVMISTPFGRNWFYRLWRRGQTGAEEDSSFASWQYSTIEGWRSRFAYDEQQLLLSEQEWEAIRTTTSERTFQQEYLGLFLEDEGQLWSLSKCLRGWLRPPMEGRSYIAGIDVARVDDWMAAVVGEVESRQLVGLIRCRQRSWDVQKATVLTLLQQYPRVHTLIDSTGVGSPIAADFRKAGLSVEDVIFTERRKKELVDNLAMAIDHGYLGVPDQPETQWLLDELRSYREWKTDSGRVKWGAPEGQHDDGVTALMLMAWGLRHDWRALEEQFETRSTELTFDQLREFTAMRRAWRRAYPQLVEPTSVHSLAWESRPKWRAKMVLQ